jgi:hypothetical protein
MHPVGWVYGLAIACLVCFWIWAKLSVSTKIWLTALYAACWGISWTNVFFGAVAQCLVAVLLIGLTMGNKWLRRR